MSDTAFFHDELAADLMGSGATTRKPTHREFESGVVLALVGKDGAMLAALGKNYGDGRKCPVYAWNVSAAGAEFLVANYSRYYNDATLVELNSLVEFGAGF